MDNIIIHGRVPLEGFIDISGAKNAALPLLCLSLLTDQPLILDHVPCLRDTQSMGDLLKSHGVKIAIYPSSAQGGKMGQQWHLQADELISYRAPYDIVRTMRASILVMGPLLARCGYVEVSLPGGCAIGNRPIDLHLYAMRSLGACVECDDGYLKVKAPEGGLTAGHIVFPHVSVGATENAIMASVFAQGTTIIEHAACEPEVVDLCECLNQMGAQIEGIGSHRLSITGVSKLNGIHYHVMPDRIEMGTYAIAAAVTGGQLILRGGKIELMASTVNTLQQAGVNIQEVDQGIQVNCPSGHLRGVDVSTAPYPGFPTDMQAQFMALMLTARGTSMVTENIFENRFMHVPEMRRMGADVMLKGRNAIVRGVKDLKGCQVMATDLRASVSLILAALNAKGETVIDRVYHLDRGYECFESKISQCGGKIRRVKGSCA